jgi:hypothetical protein
MPEVKGRIEYKVRRGVHLYVRAGGISSSHAIELRSGASLLVFDWLWQREGPVCYEGEFDDSRMATFGEMVPTLTEEDIAQGYQHGLQVHVLARNVGLTTFTDTSGTTTTALRQLHDDWVASLDCQEHKLGVYRIETPRPYTPKKNKAAGILYAPRYLKIGSIPRDHAIFGAPLRGWPAVGEPGAEIILPPVATDCVFDALEQEPETSTVSIRSQRNGGSLRALPSTPPIKPDPDLNDEVPFGPSIA